MSRSVLYTLSPLLASKTPVWRSKLIVALIALGFVGLGARAAHVQVFDNAFFQRQGEVRFARTLALPANRGRILDRNGLLLASSVPAASIWAIPEDVLQDSPADRAKLGQLAGLLDMPQADLQKKLADEDKSFVWIKRQLDWEQGQRIAALDIKGIYQRKEYKRQYPEGEAAAHVVGFTNVEDQGQEGVELAFDALLAGKAGSRRVIKDRFGRVVEGVGETRPPVDGRDMQLSIDSKVQFFAYQKLRDQVMAHKAKAGSVVVLDAHTGEVLALANYPSYLPEQRQGLSGEQLRNRALTDVFEPGSTIKPFTVGLALDSGRVHPETIVDTSPGRTTVTGLTISDTHNYGLLTVEGVIQKSSNVGVTKIAMQMPAREMWETFSAAGFGQKPQLRFPGVVTGRLRPYKSWRPIEQATMAYGYGLSASLFQMARSYTVFANAGRVIPATILKSDAAAVGLPVFSERTATQVRKMLQMAAGPGGTGQKAQTVGYSVGGKSGTARKQVGKNYASGKYRAWFTGMAPIDQPRIIVAVMIDEPGNGQFYGGAVAAPVFSSVVQQTLRMLGVPPDQAVKPQIVATVQEPL
ncbi:peptidoglycan D,D-transpeptidase FtsI family protein [Verminephrobacter eiseniae]|uniref:peptidoglycan D,D-transpeptidase FtsI family protein n=1 Tax=Verminephrobacter eiseniae TaxID=364317 RepID=UPI00223821F6|nr:penicillin-binding protein 2 [Verminephrobacter eiseniae]MCW5230300.1 penicillin-binding protein 2 [Verminephrobacter eiseniae]MCW5292034.1 penicillin-binding protein 2 [Verminephrobacter eiseniae]MCW8187745.1 penicillin-binding protein 2 [Verminephrobacter eiseniae]MCW8226017.1 penicillin-binding protein 2 [Verminephrobacter eiseniae]MCW8236466.1 penicillin-binding protein 2 [Verminephrobacter eiseniae]